MKKHRTLRIVPGAAVVLFSAALATSGLQAQSSTYNFSILAGGGVVLDHTDGSGTNARFMSPVGAAVDSSGNIYIADTGDHTIREISGNSVTTLAGTSGQAGSVNGSALSAKFVYPYAVAVDAAHNVYVADMGDNTIRKISASGTVSTLAGVSGKAGGANGAASTATFDGPEGIAVDTSGNVYVSDTNNSAIRLINTAGVVSTFAGSIGSPGSADGATTSAQFNYPGNLAIDSQGNLYVADFDNSTIRKITPAGVVSTLAGTAGVTGTVNGTAGAAHFDHPNGVAVDGAGNVYVADTSTQTIRMITPQGVVTTLAGSGYLGGRLDGTGVAARFFYPNALAATTAGTLYVADTGNHTVRMVAPGGAAGGVVTTLAGAAGMIGAANGSGTAATFNYPYGAAVDASGNVYVADQGNNLIRMISSGGNVTTLAGAGVAGSADGAAAVATFNGPSDVAVDSSGNVYVADTANSTIRKITGGVVYTFAGSAGSQGSSDGLGTAARFNRPQGVAVDSHGNVYVADTGNDTIRLITPTGQVSTFAGAPGQVGTADNVNTSARFNAPTSVTVDPQGNIYVADYGNDTIRRITTGGNVTTVAGFPGSTGDADGPGGTATFNQPSEVAADSGGNVYVTDTFNHSIRMLNTNGQVVTIGGNQSRFYYPQGIAAAGGNLYVVDGDNQSVSEGLGVVQTSGSGAVISNHSAAPGGTTIFTVGAATAGVTYQWQVSTNGGGTFTNVTNGGNYSGAATSSLTISGATAAMSGYQYRVVQNGTATPAATLYVGVTRIINLSSRANVTPGNPVVAGFYVGGSGTEQVLLRGIGPTLASYGVSPVLPNPTLTLFAQTNPPSQLQANTGWGGGTTLTNAMTAVGAFALPPTSADSAILASMTVSANTGFSSQVSSATGSGSALAEIYDMNTSGTTVPATRLINISTKALVGSGANVLVSGFVITGNTNETLLIRGDGPSLASFGVTGPLSAPVLTLYNSSSTAINTNAGWASNNAIATAAAQVGAFALQPGSADAAMLVSLAPGLYTVSVTGNGGASGTAVLEIYEVQ